MGEEVTMLIGFVFSTVLLIAATICTAIDLATRQPLRWVEDIGRG
jgi:hypothetical protein